MSEFEAGEDKKPNPINPFDFLAVHVRFMRDGLLVIGAGAVALGAITDSPEATLTGVGAFVMSGGLEIGRRLMIYNPDDNEQ